MGYLSGQGATMTFSPSAWTGDITRIRSKQTLDETQVKVLAQAHANTVTHAYHTVLTVDIAVADDLAANDLEVGASAAIDWVYGTPDKLALTSAVVVDVDLDGAVDGAIVGTITLAGNSALAHTVT